MRVTRVNCFEHFYWIRLFISKIVNTSSTPPYKFCQMCTHAYQKDRWYKHIGEVTRVNIFIISSSNQSVDLEMSTTFDGLFRNTHLVYICHIFHFKKNLNLQGPSIRLYNTCSISLSQINQVSLVKNVWLDKNFEY